MPTLKQPNPNRAPKADCVGTGPDPFTTILEGKEFLRVRERAHELFPGEDKESIARRAKFYSFKKYSDGPPFWVVWNPYGKIPRIRHISLESASQEAKRLSENSVGQIFLVLCAAEAFLNIGKGWKMRYRKYD